MSDNALWCCLALGLVAIVCATIVALATVDAYRDCQYIRGGYTRKTVPGHDWPVWVREGRP